MSHGVWYDVLLLSAVSPEDDYPKKSYRGLPSKPKPKRIHLSKDIPNAKFYLKTVLSLYRQERRLFWDAIYQQHQRMLKVLELSDEELELLYQIKPSVATHEVKFLDVPAPAKDYFYRLGLKCVNSPEQKQMFLLTVQVYQLRQTLRSFQWGDDLLGLEKVRRGGFVRLRQEPLLSLRYMSQFEQMYTLLLSEHHLQELLTSLASATLPD